MRKTNARWHWWQKGVIYQAYPLSFQDSNGDGKGDLQGIASRLDYLKWLGIDAVWLCPIFPSPMVDCGYDISDYQNINPVFGTLADFDRLIAEAHRRDIRILLDLVPNHTSDRHFWFLQSRASRENPKRSWYIWRNAQPGGGPPNNWLSIFGGSAWEWDEATGQYYYHAFLKEQPDLNWRNPEVLHAMLDVIRFWLERGTDGFRIDVVWHLIKDALFRDNPSNPTYTPDQSPYLSLLTTYSADQPEVVEVITRIRRLVDQYDDRVLIGEIYLPIERTMRYYGSDGEALHLPFNFQLIQLPWDPGIIRHAVEQYEGMLPTHGWPNWVIGNHDRRRVVSRIGPEQARVAAVLLLTLRGTPTIYYGEEIGMSDAAIPEERVVDTRGKRQPGRGRDPVRTPMQWSDGPNAGFSAAAPWLPVSRDCERVNVARQTEDARSMLALYRRLLLLRLSQPALNVGQYRSFPAPDGVVAYLRIGDDKRFLIALNLTGSCQEVNLGNLSGRVALSSLLDDEGQGASSTMTLRENEAVIIEIDESA